MIAFSKNLKKFMAVSQYADAAMLRMLMLRKKILVPYLMAT
jgi:hypothetical protein